MEKIGPDDDNETVPVPQNIIIFTDSEITKLKVVSLKKELKCRGLSHAGKKAEIVERLKKAMIGRNSFIDTQTISSGQNWFYSNAK